MNRTVAIFIFIFTVTLDEQGLKKIIALATEESKSSFMNMVGASQMEFSGTNKSFPCHICGKIFPVKHQFIGHLNTHMNRKPFCCEFCEKSFAYSTNLSRHRKTCENNPQNILNIKPFKSTL